MRFVFNCFVSTFRRRDSAQAQLREVDWPQEASESNELEQFGLLAYSIAAAATLSELLDDSNEQTAQNVWTCDGIFEVTRRWLKRG